LPTLLSMKVDLVTDGAGSIDSGILVRQLVANNRAGGRYAFGSPIAMATSSMTCQVFACSWPSSRWASDSIAQQ